MIGQHINVLNSKKRKLLLQTLNKQFGIKELPEKVYFTINDKERVYMSERSVFEIDTTELRVNAFGLYIGSYLIDGFRLTIEGSQIFGPLATKNVIDLTDEQMKLWIMGNNLEMDIGSNEVYLLRHNKDFMGTGKMKNNILSNFIPKSRALKKVL